VGTWPKTSFKKGSQNRHLSILRSENALSFCIYLKNSLLQKREKFEKLHFLQVSIVGCCRKLGFGVGFRPVRSKQIIKRAFVVCRIRK